MSALMEAQLPWGQLIILEEEGEGICDQGDRGSKGPVSCPPHLAQKMRHLPSSMDFVDRLGAAILSAISLENQDSSRDLLTAFKCVAVVCLDPGGTCLTVVV